MSRRRHRSARIDKDTERDREEAAAFVTEREEVLGKRPDSRVKWLQKALILAGKQQLKPGIVYDIVTHKEFVSGVSDKTGAIMKAMLLANLHLFSQKQQKTLQSDASPFCSFDISAASTRSSKVRGREGSPRRKRSKRSKSSSSSSDGSPRSSGTGAGLQQCPVPGGGLRRREKDPRLSARGAADDLSPRLPK